MEGAHLRRLSMLRILNAESIRMCTRRICNGTAGEKKVKLNFFHIALRLFVTLQVLQHNVEQYIHRDKRAIVRFAMQ